MQKIIDHPSAARPQSAAPMDALDFISDTLISVRKLKKESELVFDRSGRISALKPRSGLLARVYRKKDAKQKADAAAHFFSAFEILNGHHHANSAVGNSGLRSYLDQVKKGEPLTAGLFAHHLDECRLELLDKIAPGPNVYNGPADATEKALTPATPPRSHSPKKRSNATTPLSSAPYSPGTMRDPARFDERFDQDSQELEALLGRHLFAADNG